jgi:AcrR family transcriptional regulator
MPRRKPYHHGNLREVLLQAAIRLIARRGPGGFTLREVARRARVSHKAPYRHFRDKDELIAAVAAHGFLELNQAMLDAAASRSTALERLKRSGWAYVSFALHRQEHFDVMFDAPMPKTKYPECAAAGEQAFGTLLGFVEMCQREGQLPAGDSLRLALAAWSLVHGIGKLAVTERLAMHSGSEVLKFAEWAIDRSLPVPPRS